MSIMLMLQQYLPFTVLKLRIAQYHDLLVPQVATVLTVYGIETAGGGYPQPLVYQVATVLTVYGIET